MKKLLKASFTIEASLVMPIVLFSIFALIFLSFYLHDLCRIQGTLDQVLHKASISMKHDIDIETGRIDYESINRRGIFYSAAGDEGLKTDIKRYLGRELDQGLLSTDITDIDAEVGRYRIRISVGGVFNLPFTGLADFFPINRDINIEAVSPVHDPADTVRIGEVLLETGSRIKGTDALKEALGRIMP